MYICREVAEPARRLVLSAAIQQQMMRISAIYVCTAVRYEYVMRRLDGGDTVRIRVCGKNLRASLGRPPYSPP